MGQYGGMAPFPKKKRQKNYIREWMKFQGNVSFRKLAARLVNEDGTPIVSHASIQRMADGKQPYHQDKLEALAWALDTSPAALLERNPFKEAEIVDLLPLIEEGDRKTVVKMLKGMVKRAG